MCGSFLSGNLWRRVLLRRLWSLTLACTAVFALGCAGARVSEEPSKHPVPVFPPRPAYLENPDLHPVYGGPGYFKAVGSGEAPGQAELAAKAAVAAQVRSFLTAATEMSRRQIERAGSREVASEYAQVVRAETGFDRAEFIRIDPGASWREGSQYWAFAYLDKGELAAAVEPEYRQEAAAFAALAREAHSAYDRGDPALFLEQYDAARKSFSALEEKARVLSVALDAPYGPHAEMEKVLVDLVGRKVSLRNDLRFFVSLTGSVSQVGRERLEALFGRFFERAGYNAVFCAAACPCAGPLQFRFLLDARETYREGPLGPVCGLELAARVNTCPSGRTVMTLDLSNPNLKGGHTSDREIARRRLYQDLPEEVLYRTFRTALASHFPLPD